jgi:hypothetical protein
MDGEDKVVKSFDLNLLMKITRIPIITVCYNTEDYPGKYVARVWDVDQLTYLVAIADSLEEIRKAKPPGMMLVNRLPGDKPEIVETWF